MATAKKKTAKKMTTKQMKKTKGGMVSMAASALKVPKAKMMMD